MTTQNQFHAIFANPTGRIDLDELTVEFRSESGRTTYQYYDDGIGSLYVFRNSISTVGFVRAQSWEDAYGIVEDEFQDDPDMTHEEMVAEFGEEYTEDACWQEQYGFRNNSPCSTSKHKSSLYAKDLNGESLDLVTPELLERLQIQIVIVNV